MNGKDQSDERRSNRLPCHPYTLVGIVLGALLVTGLVVAAGGFLSNSAPSNNVTLRSPNGTTVTFAVNTSANLTQPFPDNDTVEWRSAKGNITLSSRDSTEASVHKITGPETRVKGLNVTVSNLTINPEDKPWVIVGENASRLAYRSPTIDDWGTDFTYAGPSGHTYLVLSGLPPDRKVKALDAHTRLRLADDHTSAAGIGVFRLPNSEHDVVLRPAAYTTSNASLPPYFDNTTPTGNLSGHVPDNSSLDNVGGLLSDIHGLVVGYGDPIPDGDTFAGTIVMGLLMAGFFLGAVSLTSAGASGGAVVASVVGYGLVELGYAPGWVRILLLFVIGAVASVAILRITR